VTAHPLGAGQSRSSTSLAATMSPRFARATTARTISVASESESASAIMLARLREPLGRPVRLPETPGWKGRPRCFPAVVRAVIASNYLRTSPVGMHFWGLVRSWWCGPYLCCDAPGLVSAPAFARQLVETRLNVSPYRAPISAFQVSSSIALLSRSSEALGSAVSCRRYPLICRWSKSWRSARANCLATRRSTP
jgi:hypothetical protein